MRVLLLSAYAAQSHRYWRQQLLGMFSDWEWTVLEMPGRYFSWRVRGNALHWGLQENQTLARGYDLVLATSMVDLATLRGLCPSLANCPNVLYFHENQFAYPQSLHQQREHALLEAQMVSLYSAIAADSLLFNSVYNRDTFLRGCAELLGRLPDFVPSDIPEMLAQKAQVIPVPVSLATARVEAGNEVDLWRDLTASPDGSRALRLLWLGRFEHDKGGEQLLAILRELEKRPVVYRLALLGQTFREIPAVFETIKREFAHNIVHYGYAPERASYEAWLRTGDVALSTAVHEFQGIAMLEAVAGGCVPLAPRRLSYPEIFPADNLYLSDLTDVTGEAADAAERIEAIANDQALLEVLSASAENFAPEYLKALYQDAMSRGGDQTLPG